MILVDKGESPLILCLPHSGTDIPPTVEKRMNATGRLQTDISWRLETVLDFNKRLDATVIRSTVSRYVIDVDQPPEPPEDPEADPLKALCPVTTLDSKRIYQLDEEPGPTEIEQRSLLFYYPFHATLAREIERLRGMHETVVVIDCRSMRSKIKGVIDTELPTLSLGTVERASCHPDLTRTFADTFSGKAGFSLATDDIFKGGYIAQVYGQPDIGIHVMTMVIAQRAYLRHETPPFELDRTETGRLIEALASGFTKVAEWANAYQPEESGEMIEDAPAGT